MRFSDKGSNHPLVFIDRPTVSETVALGGVVHLSASRAIARDGEVRLNTSVALNKTLDSVSNAIACGSGIKNDIEWILFRLEGNRDDPDSRSEERQRQIADLVANGFEFQQQGDQ